MRLNVAGFVDVGFVRAAVAAACGIETSKVRLDAAKLVALVDEVASAWSGLVLRVYWFDGQHPVDDPRHATQRKYLDAVASTPGIQLRLGHIISRTPAWHAELHRALTACGVERSVFNRHFTFAQEYQQKGVDTLMVLDIVRLAQRRAYDIAVVFSGDRDIAEAVRAAQDEGRRVTLIVPDDRSVAAELRALADEVIVLDSDRLRSLNRPTGATRRTDERAATSEAKLTPRAAVKEAAATLEPPATITPAPVEASSLTSARDVPASDSSPEAQERSSKPNDAAATQVAPAQAPEQKASFQAAPAPVFVQHQTPDATPEPEAHASDTPAVGQEPAAADSVAGVAAADVAEELFGAADPTPAHGDIVGALFGDDEPNPDDADMAGALFGDEPAPDPGATTIAETAADIAGALFGDDEPHGSPAPVSPVSPWASLPGAGAPATFGSSAPTP